MSFETVTAIFLFLLGLGLIIKGGDIFVDAATWMAEASGMPKFLVGATVVSVATTLPELFASSIAAFGGSADIAVGNAVGSVTANTGLIMGVSVIFMPLAIKRAQIGVKSGLMLFAVAVLLLLCSNGSFTLVEAALILLIFVAFIVENVYSASQNREVGERPAVTKKIVAVNLIKFVLGAAALAFGSNLLVDNGKYLAKLMGVSDRIIAITLIAVGTSLPELVTAITALVKKQGSMSVGNIIGANIIDLTLILPVCTLISGGTLTVPRASYTVDMPVCLGLAAIALLPTLIFKKFHRIQGVIMVAAYIGYLIYSVMA